MRRRAELAGTEVRQCHACPKAQSQAGPEVRSTTRFQHGLNCSSGGLALRPALKEMADFWQQVVAQRTQELYEARAEIHRRLCIYRGHSFASWNALG